MKEEIKNKYIDIDVIGSLGDLQKELTKQQNNLIEIIEQQRKVIIELQEKEEKRKEEKEKFINTNDGINYIGSDGLIYELLEGISSNNLTSDIIFIIDRNGEENPGKIIDFVYGGFENLAKDYIKEKVEEYIKNKKGDQ